MSNRSNNLAEQRICRLLDENSFMEIGSLVTARNTDFNLADEATPSDGVITGHGLIDGICLQSGFFRIKWNNWRDACKENCSCL